MLADPSPIDVVYDAGPLKVDGAALEAISLAGHSGNQMGILVDGVFFAADVVLPESILEKYRIPYLYSVTDHLRALETCVAVAASRVVPGHGALLDDIRELRNLNLAVVTETAEVIVAFCDQSRTSGEIMKHVLDTRGANEIGNRDAGGVARPVITCRADGAASSDDEHEGLCGLGRRGTRRGQHAQYRGANVVNVHRPN